MDRGIKEVLETVIFINERVEQLPTEERVREIVRQEVPSIVREEINEGLAGSLGTLASVRCGASAKGSFAPGLRLLLVLLALPLQGGCSTGSGSPLDKASAIDREFVIAAVTWDLNKDGDVTCDEWKQYVTSLFRESDANHDGVLTREEYAALSRKDRLFETVGFDYWDANHDGRISLSEMVDKPNPAFTLLDKNHDCVLTPDERVQSRGPAEDAPKDSGHLPPRGGPGGG